MKTREILIWLSILLGMLISCTTAEHTTSEKKTRISLQIGSNVGGITENTDMSMVPGVKTPSEATVDAFTGATNVGFNAGIHVNKPLRRNGLETGMDYMYNYQTFNYIDIGNKYIGIRELHVSQLMIPITYNFLLFKNTMPKADFQVKAGLIGQANFISATSTGILPEYSVMPFSGGPTLGFSAFPLNFKEGDKLGFYFDIYRGSQIYEDFYNQSTFEMPGSSFIKFGLKYQF
jgi:hypothetical protein